MSRIGVVSDTHLSGERARIPEAVLQGLAGVDAILHAGDLTDAVVLESLERIATVYAVYGNCDPPELVARLPDRLLVEFDGVRIGLTHGHLGFGGTTPQSALSYCKGLGDLRVVVFGHSHQPSNRLHEGILLFNPGSPTQRRRQPHPSYGLLEIADRQVSGQIVLLR